MYSDRYLLVIGLSFYCETKFFSILLTLFNGTCNILHAFSRFRDIG